MTSQTPWMKWWLMALAMSALAFGASSEKRSFDVPVGPAEEALKRFSQQAGVDVVFVSTVTQGVRTNAVRGEFTALEAGQRLLDGTGLVLQRDAKTGLLSVTRPASAPVAPPANAPEKNAASRPPAAPAAASAGAKGDEVLVLQEFRVDTTKDRGYRAANATTGTRLNMPIKEIPMPIEVITREFIDDIGAVDIKEALQYSAGIVQDQYIGSNSFLFSPSGTGQNNGALSRDSTTLNIRGFNTRSFLRSGFRQDTVTDVINVDRQEVARGPQSLLYGIAALGGVVNITPKYPRGTPRTNLRVGAGSEDFYRAELYNSGPIMRADEQGRALSYGLGAVYQTTSSADDFDDRTRLLVTPAIDFRPFRNTNVFLDMELGSFRGEGIGFKDVTDANAGNVRNALGLRVAENVNEFNEAAGVARSRFGKDRFFRLSGGDTFAEDDYFSGTLEVTQKILPNLSFIGAANYSDKTTTRRTLDSQGVVTTNTASAAVAPTGAGIWTNVGANPTNPSQTYWKTINYQWSTAWTHRMIRQTRFDFNYEFSVWGNKQSLLVGRQDQRVKSSDISTAQVTSNVAGGTSRSFIAFNDLSGVRYQGEQTRPFRDSVFTEWNSGHYAIYQGRWWRGKFTTIGGMRWDRYMVRALNYTYGKADPSQPDSNVANWRRPDAYDDFIGFNAAGVAQYNNPGANNGSAANMTTRNDTPRLNGYRFGGEVQRQTSPTVGLSYAITPDVSVYAVSAAGIFPNTGQRDGAGGPFAAEKTKSEELGAKFDVWKDRNERSRVSASAAFFRIERENAVYNLFWAPQSRSNNQATLRAGFTGSTRVRGTGANGYEVANSGFTSFQTNQPVTYLLPVGYVAAGDLTHPRVSGAPQQGGFILVDYASLGTAANDPLRRAMDAAASDQSNLTALQTAAVGTGATAFNANNAYALNRNSDTAYNDQTEGFDIQLYFNLTENLSSVLTYTYLTQGVTGGFRVVDQPSSTEYDSWWSYMGVPLEERRANLDEASYDFSGQIRGARTIDNPRNTVALWTKYSFTEGWLRGADIGVGVTYNGERQSEVVINNGARNLQLLENQRFKPRFPADYKVNLGIGYRAKWMNRNWNLRLNVNNLLDEQKKVAYGSSTLFINPADGALVPSTTANAQRITVPERAVRYYEPISFRLTAGVQF